MSSTPINLDHVRIDPAWSLRIPSSLALRKRVIPLCKLDERIIVACSNVDDAATLQSVRKFLDTEIEVVEADPDSMRRALARVYGGSAVAGAADSTASRLRRSDIRTPDAPDDATTACEELLQAALLRDASDIHLLPIENQLRVLYRVDGRLEIYKDYPSDVQHAIVNRFKVMAGLDIAEKRSPQDGRFTARIGPGQKRVDIRAATLPTRLGERITLRLLASHGTQPSLSSLGMNEFQLNLFRQSINRPHGMVLLTGPTGSGKSTTLYAAIEELLAARGGNVITVEDPIEYEMQGVSQVEVDTADKVSFSKALRSILRHDPDVVMIGEIRDAETAGIAVKASLTGHLVFSTLHTNSAISVVTRLLDMGVERYLVAATLRLAVAQRLVRRLCSHCREETTLSSEQALCLENPSLQGNKHFQPRRCLYCGGRGYSGRVGIFEMLPCDMVLASLIADGANESDLLRFVQEKKHGLLIEDAYSKLHSGVTSLDEVLSAIVDW